MTTIAATPPKLTPDDLLRLPDNNATELVDGRFVEKNVGYLSSDTEGAVITLLRSVAVKSGSVKVLPATMGYRCFPDDPDRIRKPDCTVIRSERLHELPDPDPGFMPLIPDFAVEVTSTNDTLKEIDEKVDEYLNAGFPLVWVADPNGRRVGVFSRGQKPSILTEDDELRCESVLPGFVCKLSDLFPPRP